VQPTREQLELAARLLKAGRLVAFPTETVYGLGANALDASAVARIYQAKGRPPTSPIIVHVHSLEMARGLASLWPATADLLAARFWPGPLTLVVPKHASIPSLVTSGLPTVGLRMPAHAVALQLIRLADVPVAAPSANRFTHLSPTLPEHVRDSLGGAVDLVLEGGPAEVGIESTVLSLAGEPALLRPGMVSRRQIESVIGPVTAPGRIENHQPHPSPGMHRRHYSPRTPLFVGAPPAVGRGAYLWHASPLPSAQAVQMPGSPTAYAEILYRTLHDVDSQGWDWIAVEPLPTDPEWDAIRDRLNRAKTSEQS
jgi:L-threonylcarbamoyladenylate synthase